VAAISGGTHETITNGGGCKERRMNWGSLGRNEWWELREESSGQTRYGVHRLVRDGTECRPLPETTGHYAWESLEGDEEGNYFMSLPVEGAEPRHETFRDLCLRVQRTGRTDEDLALLDQAADLLLDTAARMHAAGVGLGLVHPENVLLVWLPQVGSRPRVSTQSETGGLDDGWLNSAPHPDPVSPEVDPAAQAAQIVLPDANCVWHSYLQPAPPPWIKESRWAAIWDRQPLQINQSIAENQLVVAEDIRTLARLLAYMLVSDRIFEWETDGPLSRIPSKQDHPETAPGVWRVLDDALQGRIPSINAFRQRLGQLREDRRRGKTGPMAAHYRHQPKPPLTSWERIVRGLKRAAFAVAVLVLLGAVTGGAWYWQVLRPEQERANRFAAAVAAADQSLAGQDLAAAAQSIAAVEAIPASFFGSRRESDAREVERLRRELKRLQQFLVDEETRKLLTAANEAIARARAAATSSSDAVGCIQAMAPALEAIEKLQKDKVSPDLQNEIEQISTAYQETDRAVVSAEIRRLREIPVAADDAIARLKRLVETKVPSTLEDLPWREQLKRIYRSYGGQ